MTYSTLGRGPMGGDQYTQVHNWVFRDARLSGKDMGVFGHVSTHNDGWLTSAEQIAKSMKDGVGAIKASLRRLEALHYVVRHQPRDPETGRLGRSFLFITDLPAQLAALGVTDADTIERTVREAFDEWMAKRNPRSEPLAGSDPRADLQK